MEIRFQKNNNDTEWPLIALHKVLWQFGRYFLTNQQQKIRYFPALRRYPFSNQQLPDFVGRYSWVPRLYLSDSIFMNNNTEQVSCQWVLQQNYFFHYLAKDLKRYWSICKKAVYQSVHCFAYLSYSNSNSPRQTVSPSLMPIASSLSKIPASRILRSKNIRLS